MPMLLLLASTDEILEVASVDGAVTPVGPAYVGSPTGTTLELPSIDGATPVPGISAYNESVAPDPLAPNMYFELWTLDGTKISDLETQSGAQFQDVLNDVGSGSFTLQLDDPQADLVVPGTEVRCYLFGNLVFSWPILQYPRIRYADPSEEAAETLQAAGSGRPTLLGQATVYPKGLPGSPATQLDLAINAQHRIYSFASPDFPNGDTWGPAYQQVKAGTLWKPLGPDGGSWRFVLIEYTTVISGEEDVVEFVEVPAPNGWPVPDAWWIWGQPDSTPLGKNFFRKRFFVGSETSVAVLASADNYFTLYLDGTPLIGESETLHSWKDYRRVDLTLNPGWHTIGMIGVNAPFDDGTTSDRNPAAVLMAICPIDSEGEVLLPPIVQTDATWTCLPYPAAEPGWTPGQVMIDAIAEAQARGAIPGFTYDFTATNDSLGNPWPFMPGFSVPVGASLLDMLTGLTEAGWIDWRVKPGGKLLQMFNQDAIATNTGPTYDITGNVDTQEIIAQDFVPQQDIINAYLVKWTEGYLEIQDDISIGQWGRFEGFLTVDEPTEADATVQAQIALNTTAQPLFAVVVEVDPTDQARWPYEAFSVGEKVRVRNRSGALTWYQVQSIAVGQTDNARPTLILELNARLNSRQREDFELLDTLGRLVSGDTKRRNTRMMFNDAKKGTGT